MVSFLNHQVSLFNDLERVNLNPRLKNVISQWHFTSAVKLKALKEIQEAISSFKKMGTIDC